VALVIVLVLRGKKKKNQVGEYHIIDEETHEIESDNVLSIEDGETDDGTDDTEE
jgi:hypothetical protein